MCIRDRPSIDLDMRSDDFGNNLSADNLIDNKQDLSDFDTLPILDEIETI